MGIRDRGAPLACPGTMNFVLTNTVELLIAAVVVAILARRIRLSYTVGLVLAGIAIAIASFRAEGETYLTHDPVFRVILPPLLFDCLLYTSPSPRD